MTQSFDILEELIEEGRTITYGVVKPGDDPGNGVLFLRGGDIFEGKIRTQNLRRITNEVSTQYKRTLLKGGELVVSLVGNPGEVAVIPEELAGTNIARQVGLVPLRSEVNANFIMYFLRSPLGKAELFTRTKGAVQQVINLADLKTVRVPKLAEDVKGKIASCLSAYDDLIDNNRRRIQLLEESARLLYQEWFVHLRFPGHEQVKITNGVPERWTKEPLENLLVLQRGFDLPVSKRIEGKVPIYASTGVNGFHNVAKVKGPGVVTGRSGSLGTVMYVAKDYWPLNTTLWVKEFKKAQPIFATYLLRGMKLEGYNGGAAVPTLNRNDVHKVDVLCPESKLMNEFEVQVESIFKQIDKLKEYNEKLAQARDLLLPKLMSGELAV